MTSTAARSDGIIKAILFVSLAVFASLEIQALGMDSHYKYDLLICAGLSILTYLFRQQISLHWFHFLLFNIFLLTHALGMFQLYETYPLGVEYDYWVHGFFGLICAFVSLQALSASVIKNSLRFSVMATIVIALGVSALHELYEFAGAILLGEGEGVLFVGAGDTDQWDTQKDMLNNLIGTLLGVLIYEIYCYVKRS